MGNHFATEVHLEHDLYYPGNVVRGTATIQVKKPGLKCMAARIMCRGLERAVVVRSMGDYTHSVYEDSVFYKDTLTLFGHATKDSDATPVEVPDGVYTYPFAFQLPMHLPESLHTANWTAGGAEIKYQVIAYAKIDAETIEEGHHDFSVVVPINRRDADAAPPVEATAEAKLTRFFMDKGHCEVKLSVARSVYAADDTIEGTVVIDNTNGLIDVEHPRLTLRAEVVSQVSEKSSGVDGGLRAVSADRPMVTKKIVAIVPHGKCETLSFKMKLPHTVPTVSYPARGINVILSHALSVEVAGKKVTVPLHIAHCADEENRFAFCPIGDVAHKPVNRDTEHAYAPPEGYAASPCASLAPPSTLQVKEASPPPLTPQAVGNGQLHATH